ncbi:hypothetical protein V6N12_050025 [Hibiscus sabdariffa]|uniref:Uncharacterized protein n=1 Tax=Hibiscus sabdariffa TaxID=183260 RepID=A0ABR2GCC9_9ROSI
MLFWLSKSHFDLVENEHHAFLLNVRGPFPASKSPPSESIQPRYIQSTIAHNENFTVLKDVLMTDESSATMINTQEIDPKECCDPLSW